MSEVLQGSVVPVHAGSLLGGQVQQVGWQRTLVTQGERQGSACATPACTEVTCGKSDIVIID